MFEDKQELFDVRLLAIQIERLSASLDEEKALIDELSKSPLKKRCMKKCTCVKCNKYSRQRKVESNTTRIKSFQKQL